MNFLLLYIEEGIKFDNTVIVDVINSIAGVYSLRKGGIGAVIEWQFDYLGDSTIGRLQPDIESITLSGNGIAALRMAFDLQTGYGTTIRLTNADYSFDLEISGFSTFDMLKAAVLERVWKRQIQ